MSAAARAVVLLAAALSVSMDAGAAEGPPQEASQRASLFESREIAEARAVLAAIDACRTRLDPATDIGYERIAARCPQLIARIEHSALSAWLPRDWKEPRNDLSPGSLAELQALAARQLDTRASGAIPRLSTLREVLAALGHDDAKPDGWWERFRRWLRRMLAPEDDAPDPGWFARALDRVGLSRELIERLTFVALAAIVVLAVWIASRELRAAALAMRRGRRGPAAIARATAARVSRTLEDVDRAGISEQPRMLLELLVDRLRAVGRLPDAGTALTHREVVRAARLDDPADRTRLASLASVAERLRYAPQAQSADVVRAAVQEGRRLLGALDVAPIVSP